LKVGVVGPPGWAEDVAAAAPAWRREVVTWIDPHGIDGAVLSKTAVDELVVSERSFAAVIARLPYASRARIATLVGYEGCPEWVFAPALRRRARAVKRLLDLVIGGVAIVATAPVVAAAMVAIRLESPGPVLFRQMRPGLNGRAFCLLKLRTMYVDNDDRAHQAYLAALIGGTGDRQGGMYKMTNDPRITRVGRVLRRYSIDELPQLVNVVRGEMSLVGPRPPVPAEVDHYDAERWLRLRVKPGMTGAWQVAGRCERTYAEMVALDIGYWQQWSLRSELGILVRTVPVVLGARGAA
jgi:lipopolysaccharide/colanic/teichoic acid biosynthesis glycosyltransferase